VRHRTLWIESRSFLERTNRGRVIEAVEERDALIEVALRLRRFRRDLARVRSEALE
jgi:hypothetical protein